MQPGRLSSRKRGEARAARSSRIGCGAGIQSALGIVRIPGTVSEWGCSSLPVEPERSELLAAWGDPERGAPDAGNRQDPLPKMRGHRVLGDSALESRIIQRPGQRLPRPILES